jgi:hypothetical protein
MPAFREIQLMRTDEPWLLTFQKLEEKRRDVQNRRYWAIMHEIAEQLKINEQQMTAETWHEWAKRRFIGVREIVLPDGEIVVMGMSSTDLSVAEFSDYMQMVEAWAVDHGVIFNDLPARA